jgi:NAD-dependent DNA ligase
MTDERTSSREYRYLADLPGIGPTKAAWIAEAGMESVDAVRRASVDDLAHVRGVGYVLARRIKDVLATAEIAPESSVVDEFSAAQRVWRERIAALRVDLGARVDALVTNAKRLGLKPKFVQELQRVRGVLDRVPIENPPEDEEQRRKIAKHEQALLTLVESAEEIDPRSGNYQKTLRKRIKSRRKKLNKWN